MRFTTKTNYITFLFESRRNIGTVVTIFDFYISISHLFQGLRWLNLELDVIAFIPITIKLVGDHFVIFESSEVLLDTVQTTQIWGIHLGQVFATKKAVAPFSDIQLS